MAWPAPQAISVDRIHLACFTIASRNWCVHVLSSARSSYRRELSAMSEQSLQACSGGQERGHPRPLSTPPSRRGPVGPQGRWTGATSPGTTRCTRAPPSGCAPSQPACTATFTAAILVGPPPLPPSDACACTCLASACRAQLDRAAIQPDAPRRAPPRQRGGDGAWSGGGGVVRGRESRVGGAGVPPGGPGEGGVPALRRAAPPALPPLLRHRCATAPPPSPPFLPCQSYTGNKAERGRGRHTPGYAHSRVCTTPVLQPGRAGPCAQHATRWDTLGARGAEG